MNGFSTTSATVTAQNIPAFSIASPRLDPLPICTSIAQAERYVDRIAASLGFPARGGSSWSDNPHIRKIVYQDGGNIELTVAISSGGIREGNQSWCISGSAKRKDAGFYILIPRHLRPSAFRKEAAKRLAQLHRLRVYPGARLVGRLISLTAGKDYGYLECLPGTEVYVAREELVRSSGGNPISTKWFSFQIQSTTEGQQATNLLPCAPQRGAPATARL